MGRYAAGNRLPSGAKNDYAATLLALSSFSCSFGNARPALLNLFR